MSIRFSKFVLLMILVAAPAALLAFELPRDSRVPGGIAVITLGSAPEPAPLVHFQGQRVLTLRPQEHWVAVVGIPLDARPGKHQIQVQRGKARTLVPFEVKPKEYSKQHIKLPTNKHVDLSEKDLARHNRELSTITQPSKKHFSAALPSTLRMQLPFQGRVSSQFGHRRIINGKPRNPHSGMDLAAPEGTPIRAPLAGTVLATGNLFFNGNTVFIDHGSGLVSMYCHMNTIDVAKGTKLNIGDVFATVGKTGRATGPHLHWSVFLNGEAVDPELFLAPD